MNTPEYTTEKNNLDRAIDANSQKKWYLKYDYENSFFSYLKDLKKVSQLDTELHDELIFDITELSFKFQQALLQFAPAVNEELQYINEIINGEAEVEDYFFNSSILALGDVGDNKEFFSKWRKDIKSAMLNCLKSYNSPKGRPATPRKKLLCVACQIKIPSNILDNFYRLILNYLFMWSGEAINYECNLRDKFSLQNYSKEQIDFLADKFLLRPAEIEERVWEIYHLREQLIKYKHTFLETHLRLVINLAKKFNGSGLPFSDVVQEGNLGLMKAIDKFDLLLGHKFSTYASWWIKHNIIRGIAGQARTIRIPTHMLNLIAKINRAEQKLLQDFGREPESAEIAALLGISVAKINAVRRMARQAISLQSPIQNNHEDLGKFEEILEDESVVLPGDAENSDRNYDKLYELLKSLTEREQQIIILRFGLFGNKATPLREISEKFGLTRERIRQLEKKIIEKLRNPKLLQYLREYHH